MMPSSLTIAHFSVCWSLWYGGFAAADCEPLDAPAAVFSSMNTSETKLLMIEGLIEA